MSFCHLKSDDRVSGENVKAGQIIGYQGDSGNLSSAIKKGLCSSHVHIGVRENGVKVNPLNYMKFDLNLQTGNLTEHNDCN